MDNTTPTTPEQAPAQAPVAPTPVPPVAMNQPAKPSVELKNTSVVSGKSHTGLFIVLGVIIVLVALIGAAFWYLNTQSQKPVATQNPLSTTATVTKTPAPEDNLEKDVNDITIDQIDTSSVDQDLQKLQ